MTIDKLEHLIRMQLRLQHEFGFNFDTMPQEERIAYIRDQHQAVTMEMSEVLDEVDWKPWTNNSQRLIHRDEYVTELIDVLHFWINMVLVVSGEMSSTEIADEIFTRYALKNRVNVQRQADGYDGRSTKCGGCGRALDDVAVPCWRRGDQGHCARGNIDVNYVISGDRDVNTILETSRNVNTIETINPVCSHCNFDINRYSCVPATSERWGHCGADQRQLPPIKLPVT